MNWDDARIFLALQRERTLRGAARTINLDQATVGRRVAALERALGATLFFRTSEGYVLTPIGETVLQSAEKLEQVAHELVLQAQGGDARLQGEVRVATTDSLALEFVIPAICELHRQHPEVQVSLNTSTHVFNLAKRETDIAVRTMKPENPDLIARRLADWPMALYCAPSYLERMGEPEEGTAFEGHDLIIYQPYLDTGPMPTLANETIQNGRIVAAANSSLMLRTMVRQGLGVTELPTPLAERDGLVRLWPHRARAHNYEVWLVTHQDLRHTARVKAAIAMIVEQFERLPPPA
jgi:DNA-binding transcriptional LysR family regulator